MPLTYRVSVLQSSIQILKQGIFIILLSFFGTLCFTIFPLYSATCHVQQQL